MVETIKDPAQIGTSQHPKHHTHNPGDRTEGSNTEAAKSQTDNQAGDAAEHPSRWLGLLVAEQQGREHRREGDGVESRNRDRESDRQGELAINDADAAWIESHRHEHRHQNQCRGDQGADQFAHAVQSCLAGAHATLEILRHRFNHHNGVIDDKAGRQHKAEQGELVDGETEGLDEGKSAHQRDWNRQARNHRGAPVLQEEIKNKQHQHDGQTQGVNHALNSRFDELANIINLTHRHSGRHGLTELVHHRHHRFGNIQSVALRCLENGNGQRGRTLLADSRLAKAVEAVDRLAHILEPQQVAHRRTSDDEVVEIVNGD